MATPVLNLGTIIQGAPAPAPSPAPAQAKTPNVRGMVTDPDFAKLTPNLQRQALAKLTGDQEFLKLSDADTTAFAARLGMKAGAPAPAQSFLQRVEGGANDLVGGAASSFLQLPAELAKIPGFSELNKLDPTRGIVGPEYQRLQNAAAPPDPNGVAATVGRAGEQMAEMALLGPERFGVGALEEGLPRAAGTVAANSAVAAADAKLHGESPTGAAIGAGAGTVAAEAVPALADAASALRNRPTAQAILGPTVEAQDPVKATVRALRARNIIKDFPQSVRTALPDVRRALDSMGVAPGDVTPRQFEAAIGQAKADVWKEFEHTYLDTTGDLRIPTDDVASAIQQSLRGMTPRAVQEHGNVFPLAEQAIDEFRGASWTMSQIEDRIQELNNELRGLQRQFKINRDAMGRMPQYAYRVAELNGLRKIESDAFDSLVGSGAKALKARYGALKTLQDVTDRQIPVIERQSADGLYGSLGSMGAAANMAEGAVDAATGRFGSAAERAARGAAEWKIGRNLQTLRDPQWLLRASMTNTVPTEPFVPTENPNVWMGTTPVQPGPVPPDYRGLALPPTEAAGPPNTRELPAAPERKLLTSGKGNGPITPRGMRRNPTTGRMERVEAAPYRAPDEPRKPSTARAKSILIRDVKTGRMKRVYLSGPEGQ